MEIENALPSPLLTDKQEKFAQVLVATNDAVGAQIAAYGRGGGSWTQIRSSASKNLCNPRVRNRVRELQEQAVRESGLTMELAHAFLRNVLVWTADPRELCEVRVGNCRHCHGQDFGYVWRVDEYATAVEKAQQAGAPLPPIKGGVGYRTFDPPHEDCPECGGGGIPHAIFKDTAHLSMAGRLLYRGVEVTRDGMKVKMADQDAAGREVVRMLGGYKDTLDITALIGMVSKSASVQFNTDDPHQAAKVYEDMIKGRLT